MNDFVASVIRTVTALVVGSAITFAAKVGVQIDSASATLIVGQLVTAAWYSAVRWLESRVDPRFGWLLGLAKAPTYVQTSV